MKPRDVTFDLKEIFGEAAKSTHNYQRRIRRYDNRGSSMNWNDDNEFATPIPQGKNYIQSQDPHNLISHFSPL
jgi:hypothetical protein